MNPERARLWLTASLVLMAIAAWVTWLQMQPPAPRPASAPVEDFSEERARAALQRILGDGAPHPTGSSANAGVRDRIIDALKSLGLAPRIQEDFVCGHRGVCAQVHNILARIPGREDGKSVLAVAHYDSVPAGPGAADDGSGVASLIEAARALRAGPPPRHSVILLFNEGEELGMLGAKAFMDDDPWRHFVGVIVNVDSRGTSGASRMFETSGPNGWLIDALAQSVPHPVMTSVFSAVYDLLPNRTDLTVFKDGGLPGVNFAFIGDPIEYHTSLDTLADLDARTLQHQGENALAAVRAFAESDLDAPAPPKRVVFFDLLGLCVVRWPQDLSVPLALMAIGLVLGRFALLMRSRPLRMTELAGSLGAVMACVLAAALLGHGLAWLLSTRSDASTQWIANPAWAITAAWGIGLSVASWLTGAPDVSWTAVWLLWSFLSLVAAWWLPGISYLFTVPALVAGLAGLARPHALGLATVLPSVAAGLVWMPIAHPWYDAVGVPLIGSLSVCALLLGATVSPLLAATDARFRFLVRRRTATTTLAFVIMAAMLPQHSSAVPTQASIIEHEDADTGKTQWLVETGAHLPDALKKQGSFQGPLTDPSWNVASFFAGDARPADFKPPSVRVIDDTSVGGERRLKLHLQSERDADFLQLAFAPDSRLRSIRLNGIDATEDHNHGWRRFVVWGRTAADVEVVLDANGSPNIVLSDESWGVPPEAASLIEARHQVGVPYRSGDRVVVTRKLTLPTPP